MIKEKKCTICGETKPETEFYWKNKSKKKRSASCGSCIRDKRKREYGMREETTKQKEDRIRKAAEAEAQLFNQVNQLWR